MPRIGPARGWWRTTLTAVSTTTASGCRASSQLSGRKRPGQGYDGPVVYMGTLSKEIAPGLRVGWVVAAPEMIEALTVAKHGSDMCTSGVTQRIALGALEGGLIDRLQPLVASLYRERRDALCAALSEHLAEWFDWEVPVGEMFVWAEARDPSLDTDRLLPLALQAGVCIAPSSAFDASGRNRHAMRVNFTLNPPDRLAEGGETPRHGASGPAVAQGLIHDRLDPLRPALRSRAGGDRPLARGARRRSRRSRPGGRPD